MEPATAGVYAPPTQHTQHYTRAVEVHYYIKGNLNNNIPIYEKRMVVESLQLHSCPYFGNISITEFFFKKNVPQLDEINMCGTLMQKLIIEVQCNTVFKNQYVSYLTSYV